MALDNVMVMSALCSGRDQDGNVDVRIHRVEKQLAKPVLAVPPLLCVSFPEYFKLGYITWKMKVLPSTKPPSVNAKSAQQQADDVECASCPND
eukprot:CAMPEP_0167815766 /NCGR_PEP_ID=MMETSP0112_2-20121227/3209_1 /TAXON_ID=91324 /ORGANISM="Lotharella globosa, Strain CCCM811" /LENGTH=92 /DNA_ID=CAMNT_0007715231 /DNA_START=424 /DNA_END=699 /DNA_ORIENTATION=+